MNSRLHQTFDHDYEMWAAYDYAACLATDHDVYRPANWEKRGGVNDSGYVWVDDTQWSVDTPENPVSILAIMTWRQWFLRGPADLRNATLTVHLRGENLNLRGGKCCFWAMSRKLCTRWHLSTQPLTVANGTWSKTVVLLVTDAGKWHRSWTVPGQKPGALEDVLSQVESYGLSFLGFDGNVTGRLCMDEFELKVVT